jgi:hypothetical protein
VKGNEVDVRERGDSKGGGWVMLSYSWAQQDAALALRRALGEGGVDVWIDVERMEGDILVKSGSLKGESHPSLPSGQRRRGCARGGGAFFKFVRDVGELPHRGLLRLPA